MQPIAAARPRYTGVHNKQHVFDVRRQQQGRDVRGERAAECATHAHTEVERSEPRGVRTLVRELAWARYAHAANVAT